MLGMSIRFENSAVELFGMDAFQLNDLGRTGEAAHAFNRGCWHPGEFSEEAHDRFVGFAIYGRRGDLELPDVSLPMPARKFGPSSSCAYFKRESRFHWQPSFATEFGHEDR